MSGEFEDEYSATIDDDLRKSPDDVRAAGGALLNDTIAVLSPAEPLCLPASATVHDAVRTMLAHRQAGVLVVDGEGRLAGIFTERDVLTRVVGQIGRASCREEVEGEGGVVAVTKITYKGE